MAKIVMSTTHGFEYFDTKESIEAAITSCAQVVDVVRREVQDLRVRQNAIVPAISRLPAETLAEVFLAFKEQHRARLCTEEEFFETRPVAWLVVMHVCRRWRVIASDFPRLWQHIPMRNNEDFVRTFLERSKNTPLFIAPGPCPCRPSRSVLNLLVPSAHRMRSLRLRCGQPESGGGSTPALDIWSADSLEHIDISLVC